MKKDNCILVVIDFCAQILAGVGIIYALWIIAMKIEEAIK